MSGDDQSLSNRDGIFVEGVGLLSGWTVDFFLVPVLKFCFRAGLVYVGEILEK